MSAGDNLLPGPVLDDAQSSLLFPRVDIRYRGCAAALPCGVTLRRCLAALHCGVVLRRYTAALSCGVTLRRYTAALRCAAARRDRPAWPIVSRHDDGILLRKDPRPSNSGHRSASLTKRLTPWEMQCAECCTPAVRG